MTTPPDLEASSTPPPPPYSVSPAPARAQAHFHAVFASLSSSTMSLNPEPAAPEEREAQQLPPKSYADAAEEALTPNAHVNGVDGTKERKAQNIEKLQTNGRITIPSADDKDKDHYEGEGQDNSPKSPSRGHKRVSSRKSNGSIGRKYGEQLNNSEVFEKFQDGNGHALVSAKPPAEYEKDARQDGMLREELTTGREAGAGWHKSKYATISIFNIAITSSVIVRCAPTAVGQRLEIAYELGRRKAVEWIRWAPFNVPVKRRLQTLAVLMHTLSIAGLLGFFFLLCSIPLLWPILVPYLIYALMSNAGASGELYFRSERCRRLPVWSLFASYFPMRLHRVQQLEPTRKYIFGYHPHGIISHGAFAAFATEALGFGQLFPGITNTLLTLDSNFRLPLYREYALRMGLASVSRESIQSILSRGGTNGEGMGRAVTIVIGGAREALEARPGHLRLVVERRKGFVKMAIRTGADLVPVVAFGENDIYDQFDVTKRPVVKKLQMFVKTAFGFTAPLFHARGIFNYDVGLMPYRKPINIVVGKPIRVKQESHPDRQSVDKLHAEYMAELQRLWDDWKGTFAEDRVEEMKFIE